MSYTYIHINTEPYVYIYIYIIPTSNRQTRRMSMIARSDLHERLLEKIGERGVVDNIWAFARDRIPDELSLDVRSYCHDMWLIVTMYNTQFSPDSLTGDLIWYMACHATHTLADGAVVPGPEYLKTNTSDLGHWRRHHLRSRVGALPEEREARKRMMCNALRLKITTETGYRAKNGQNRRFIGLLTPKERTAFINDYLLAE